MKNHRKSNKSTSRWYPKYPQAIKPAASDAAWLRLDIFLPGQRLKYCTEKHGEPLGPTEPILTEEMFQEAGTSICELGEIGWFSKLEHFEAEQPALDEMLNIAAQDWTGDASACLDLLTLSIHETFKRHFPAPAVVPEDLREIAARISAYFHKPKVCLCNQYQGSLMKAVIADIESFIDDGTLTPVEGNRVALLTAIVIQALDEAATLAQWSN